jgi:hypothetical protein
MKNFRDLGFGFVVEVFLYNFIVFTTSPFVACLSYENITLIYVIHITLLIFDVIKLSVQLIVNYS